MIAIGIDPASTYGIAIVSYPTDELIGSLQSRDPGEGLAWLARHVREHGAERLAIEDQWLGFRRDSAARGKAIAAVKVAHRAGEWAGRAHALGAPPAEYVKPQTWRAVYQKTKRGRGWSKSEAIKWVRALYGVDLGKEHDRAEAILIARWAAVRGYLAEMGSHR